MPSTTEEKFLRLLDAVQQKVAKLSWDVSADALNAEIGHTTVFITAQECSLSQIGEVLFSAPTPAGFYEAVRSQVILERDRHLDIVLEMLEQL